MYLFWRPRVLTPTIRICNMPSVCAGRRLYSFSHCSGLHGTVIVSIALARTVTYPTTLEGFVGLAGYVLRAVVTHTGTATGGHYIAHVRRGDNWYCCNDATVTAESGATVLSYTRNAYSFLYTKV